MSDAMLAAALSLAERGFAAHWLRHRSKAPVAEGWSTAAVADLAMLRRTYRKGFNVGVRCGHYSTPAAGCGLVIMDTDIKVPTYTPEALDVLTDLLGLLDAPAVASGRRNGSRHDWRACPLDRLPPKAAVVVRKSETTWVPAGKRRPEPVWQIEVLSTGKQVVVPPSIHPTTGYAYDWIAPLDSLPLLPESVHVAVEEVLATSVRLSTYDAAAEARREPSNTGHRPGDDFNACADWVPLLERHGWTLLRRQGDVSYWRRPGKRDPGCSASVNYGGRDLLYVFSLAAPPVEAERAYRKFTAYTLLEYGGDFDAAAKALRRQGYGDQRTVSETSGKWPSRIIVEVT
jgi:hypothetical protein